MARKDVLNSEILTKFLQTAVHAQDNLVNTPEMIYEFKDFIYGIRDVHIDPQDGLMIVVCGDMNLLTRMDAYVSNIKMPWEDENQTSEGKFMPVGSVEMWIQHNKGPFDKVWAKTFPSQAICLYWSKPSLSLFVGLDSGHVHQLTLDPDFKKFNANVQMEVHVQRVMGIYFDEQR